MKIHIMANLMFMPGLRKPLLDELRNLQNNNACSKQQIEMIDHFFQTLHTAM